MSAGTGRAVEPDLARLREPEVVEVATGVLAVVQYDGGWCLANAGVIAGPRSTVVVDTMATERRARRLRAIVDSVARGPGMTVVNTHHHGDHTFGNFVFAEDATVLAHELTAHHMAELGLVLQSIWTEAEWGQVRLALPSQTYQERHVLDDGERAVEVLHVGPAHTPDDSVVHLPDEGVLFVGDVVLGGATPFCLMGSVSGSLRAIARLRGLGARVLVPGHGPIGGPELLDEAEDYLRWIQRLAREGADAGLEPLELARESDLGRFGTLRESERLVGNLARAYAEAAGAAEGAPLDVPKVFGDMVAYHGAMPVCHA
jgi:cyclase